MPHTVSSPASDIYSWGGSYVQTYKAKDYTCKYGAATKRWVLQRLHHKPHKMCKDENNKKGNVLCDFLNHILFLMKGKFLKTKSVL